MLKHMLEDSVMRIGLSDVWVDTVLIALLVEGFCELRSIDMCIHWHRYNTTIVEEIYLPSGGMYYVFDGSSYYTHEF